MFRGSTNQGDGLSPLNAFLILAFIPSIACAASIKKKPQENFSTFQILSEIFRMQLQ